MTLTAEFVAAVGVIITRHRKNNADSRFRRALEDDKPTGEKQHHD